MNNTIIKKRKMKRKANNIDPSLPSYGIPREFFTDTFEAYLKGSSLYQNKPLYKLLKYDKKEQVSYYVDDFIEIEEAGKLWKRGNCYVGIRPLLFSENEKAKFFLDTKLDKDYDPTNTAVSFVLYLKESQRIFVGTLITPKCFIRLLKISMKHDISEGYSTQYVIHALYERVVNEITHDFILSYFDYLIERKDWTHCLELIVDCPFRRYILAHKS